MSRTMYDSTTPAAIPSGARVVAWYLDGAVSAWPAGSLDRFADAVKVSITVTGHPGGDIGDVENGDLTPASAAAWIRARGGHRSTIYTFLDNLPAVRDACKGLVYDVWVADWTGQPHAIDGAVAVQYADPAHGSGGDFDLSVVTDASWYPSPPTAAERLAEVAALAAKITAVAS